MPRRLTRARPRRARALVGWTAVVLATLVGSPGAARARDLVGEERTARARCDSALAAGDVPGALRAADAAFGARRARVHGRPRALTGLTDSLGLACFMEGSPPALEGALTWFDRSRSLRQRVLGPNDLALAQTLSTLSTLHDYLGRYEQGLALERRALAIRRARLPPGDVHIADSQRQIGQLLFELGRYDEAAEPMSAAAASYAALDLLDATPMVETLNALGEIHRALDHLPQAEAAFRSGVDLAHARLAVDDAWRPVLANNLAGLYKDLGRYDEAEPLLMESLAARGTARPPDSTAIATAQLNLAELYRLQGRPDDARPLYDAALATSLAALGPDHPDRVLFVNQAALLYASIGRFGRAESLYRETGAVIQRMLGTEHPLYAQHLNDVAGMLEAEWRFPAAESTYDAALALRLRVFGPMHPDVAVTRARLAHCLLADPHGDLARAETLLTRAITVLDISPAEPEECLEAYASRSRLRERAGDRAGATADLERALGDVDRLRARRGGGDRTRAGYLARHLNLFDTLVGWQIEAGRIDRAFLTHERGRARALRDQIAGSGVDMRAGIPPGTLAPLDAAERGARERLAQAQRALDELRSRGDIGESDRFAGVARLAATRDSAAWALERARDAIQDQSPLWRQLLSADGRPAGIEDIRPALAARHATLLEYHVGDSASVVFVVPPSPAPARVWPLRLDASDARTLGVAPGPITGATIEQVIAGRPDARAFSARVGIADELSGQASPDVVAPLTASDQADPRERRLHALWHALAPESLWSALHGTEHVVVVPDGALHLLPFEALVISTRSPAHPVRYWLDEIPGTLYAASATSVLGQMRRDAARVAVLGGGPAVLSVCDPRFRAPDAASPAGARGAPSSDSLPPPTGTLRALERLTGWARLPGTRIESARVVHAFAPDSVQVLSDSAATEPATREALPGKRFVHLASHGFVTDTRGELLAGLALAPPVIGAATSDNDGLLQLYEIYELHLSCELAVLSACETHRGPRLGGEGVFALSRGFLAAGAERVVASLWSVRDDATAELIGGFFERVARERDLGLARDDARLLGDAKRALRARADGANPTDWAAFILTGSP